jgi:type IV pilus assembly protein PilV
MQLNSLRARARRSSRGVSLIEVLVAILVLLFGILGMVGLQARASQAEFESYQRRQALILLQDMMDRLRANIVVASCYAITDAQDGAPYWGGPGSQASSPCASSGSLTGTAEQRLTAVADIQEWTDMLSGVAEKKSGTNVGVMIDARGCISDLGGGLFSVAVAWQGTSSTSAPPSALTCGKDLYASEGQRRVVSATVLTPQLN